MKSSASGSKGSLYEFDIMLHGLESVINPLRDIELDLEFFHPGK